MFICINEITVLPLCGFVQFGLYHNCHSSITPFYRLRFPIRLVKRCFYSHLSDTFFTPLYALYPVLKSKSTVILLSSLSSPSWCHHRCCRLHLPNSSRYFSFLPSLGSCLEGLYSSNGSISILTSISAGQTSSPNS